VLLDLDFRFTAFYEVRAVLAQLSTYTPLKQEYAACVAWPSRRRVKAQYSYLPSSYTHPTIYYGQTIQPEPSVRKYGQMSCKGCGR
jgi:hypothetical protein